MEAVVFELRGETAFFKKPEVNQIYFTYSQIHKVAILGMLGAIIGLNGYGTQDTKKKGYPEFYDKLKSLKIGIVPMPCRKLGNIVPSKKLQVYNNSVGYASEEQGGNLIVREQWLEHPRWKIYIFNTDTIWYERIKDYLVHSKCEYIPYLGKNDHFATIENVRIVNMQSVNACDRMGSLYPASQAKILEEDDIDDDYEEHYYKYQEKLPVGLEPEHNQYILEKFIFTNKKVILTQTDNIYKDCNRIIYAI